LIGHLRGAALKANEDCLDAVVCVLIAAYHQRQQSYVFGDDQSGFIVVPYLAPTN
jgi:predicted RNase H-like nuclease